MTIQDLTNEYRGKIDYLDMEILTAHSLGKTREFVLMYPEYKITSRQSSVVKRLLQRRIEKEPVAYILGHKEFYGLNFVVNKDTLVPRPETEMIVEGALVVLRNMMLHSTTIMDIGTGSGNIIISIAKGSKIDAQYFASDTSKGALKIAKKNSRLHGVDKKIKFIESDLLSAFIRNTRYEIRNTNLIITANLPYLSKDIYNSAPVDVKKFEPRSALYSPEQGLQHYRKLLKQVEGLIANNKLLHITLFLEISPEQKTSLAKIIKTILPSAKIEFSKDLAGKWRICKMTT